MEEIITTYFNPDIIRRSFPLLLRGLVLTLQLAVVSIGIGLVTGLVVALFRLSHSKLLRILTVIYIDLFRAVPPIVLLIFVYFALPYVGVTLNSFVAATLALVLIASAYNAEVYRTGIQAVPKGQVEAARSLGLNPLQTFRFVVFPQALQIAIPPLVNNSIAQFKDTALASVVALSELLRQAQQAQAVYANPTPLTLAALIYIAILWPLVRYAGSLERRG
jgi:polar amino acid transport system permease protein